MTSGGSTTVLVADDDAELRTLVAEYLSSHGFDVLQAANGLEALLHVKRNVLKAAVIDLTMPRLGGLEAIKRIRAFTPQTRIVVVTGEMNPEIEPRARALGAATVLFKPIELTGLLRAVRGEPPLEADEPQAQPPPAPPARVAVALPGTAASVLLVDDDDGVREMLEELLTSKGFTTRSVADAATALRIIEATPPDVILLDIEMPGLNGVHALPAIRAVAPQTYVIMVSGTSDAVSARQALSYGAFDYVTKPVDIIYLTRSIEAALAAKALDE